MPLYKFHMQIQGAEVYAAGHVYEISNDYAEALNTEKPGCCERWDPTKVEDPAVVHEPNPKPPLLKGDAWRAKGEEKKRIGSGL